MGESRDVVSVGKSTLSSGIVSGRTILQDSLWSAHCISDKDAKRSSLLRK
jgi:hypothetical protein